MKKTFKRVLALILALAMLVCIPLTAGAAVLPEDSKKSSGNLYVTELGNDIYMIDDTGISTCYLIIGEEKCLIIDTGVGKKDFRKVVEKYAQGKPIECILTHNHVDHAGAVGQFDTFYMNKADLGNNYHQDLLVRNVYGYPYSLTTVMQGYGYGAQNIGDNMAPNQQVYYLNDGDVIDLGGRQVTYYWTPGHTMGSAVLIDSKTKYMFTGDIANPVQMNYWLESTDLDTWADTLKRIQGFLKDGTAVKAFNGHETSYKDQGIGNIVIMGEPGTNTTVPMIQALIDTVTDVKAGNYRYDKLGIILKVKTYKKDTGKTGVVILMTLNTKINAHPGGSVITNAKDYSTGEKAK